MNNAAKIDDLKETLRKLDSIISMIWDTAENKGLCYEVIADAADIANDLVTGAKSLVESLVDGGAA